jgi:hypothetical protein
VPHCQLGDGLDLLVREGAQLGLALSIVDRVRPRLEPAGVSRDLGDARQAIGLNAGPPERTGPPGAVS